jgi:hypothetical protein
MSDRVPNRGDEDTGFNDESFDAGSFDDRGKPVRGGFSDDDRPLGYMGGTSDAGTAADDAAQAAAYHEGLPDDRTKWTSTTPGAGTNADRGARGSSGETISDADVAKPLINEDETAENGPSDPAGWA